ncbi:conserved hypothetical protein [Magnetospirillum sp. LM-5]|uniref:hypothetical protein n=1 Tax=Magnetospirillum sp. LM-5 TaxID=2681466 RepID=UPI00138643F6|nr:hypothetical protein [Magnetospirillum sp. LM-5]CAA7616442.1 conserved hypothetical protein [Magnetospirillum sp. LM-5]
MTEDLAFLTAEKKRLDQLLDNAMDQYALVEEDLNVRMKGKSGAELDALMAERARIEDTLGIVALVERIDVIREKIEALRG